MHLIKIHVNDVVIKDRIRSDLGPREGTESIMGLAQSMREIGQIQPVVIDGNELKAGGRRMAAALFLFANNDSIGSGLPDDDVRKLAPGEIYAIQYAELPRRDQIRIEIDENTRRKGFSKAEDALAIKRLQNLLNEEAGHVGGQNVSVREVARVANVSAATVTMGLRVANAVEGGNATLLQKNSIAGAYQSLLSQEKLAEKTKQIKQSIPTDQLSRGLFHSRAEDWIVKLPNASIDLWSFDPPWGIGVDEYDRQHKYDGEWADDKDTAKKLMDFLVPHMYRTLKPDSWMFSFFGIQFYEDLKNLFVKSGFKVYPVPYIWYKPNKLGAQNDPSRFDINMYEPIFLLAKGEPRIFKQVQGNVLIHDMPPRSDRFHFAQKPVELYKALIERFSFGNMVIADPTAGSFAVAKAAKQLGRQYLCCEANKENYDNGVIFVNS